MTVYYFKTILRLQFMAFASIVLMACGGGITGNANNFIMVDDQVVIELDQIILASASLNQTVCVVVYEATKISEKVKSQVIVGVKTLGQGVYENVPVLLQREILNKEILFAELREGECGESNDNSVAIPGAVIAQNGVSSVSFKISRSTTPYIEVNSQSIVNAFNVDKVIADQSSWIVIHRYDDTAENTLGEIVGYQLISAGHTSHVKVILQERLDSMEEFIVALYINETELLDEDFILEDDSLIIETISEILKVEIADSTKENTCENCIRFSLKSLGTSAYRWDGDAAAKNQIKQNISGNETLQLSVGDRIEITNLTSNSHPLEFFNSSNQQILLSQKVGVVGAFENEPDVNWTDNYGIIMFTLTPALAELMTNYRCVFHRVMAGRIDLVD